MPHIGCRELWRERRLITVITQPDHRRSAVAAMIIATLLAAGCSRLDTPGPNPESRPASSSEQPSVTSPSASVTQPSSPTPGPTSSTPSQTPAPAEGSVRVERTVAENLNVPWGFALLPGGEELMITSRDTAMITRIDLRNGNRTEVGEVPDSVPGGDSSGEGGLLGLAISPDFEQDQQLFVYYTSDQDNRIARYRYHPDRGNQLSGATVIVRGIPAANFHNGGRLAFGPDGMLYATTGEAGNTALSQDLDSLGGKILRMTPDGRPAPENPDPDSLVWTHGHRNVQGIAWDRGGRLWASEFGQNSTDELNLIEAGNNYGWPDAEGESDDDRFTDPVAQWGTDEDSPSGIAFAGGSIWMAALQGERLWRIPLDGRRTVADPQDFLTDEYGRLRSVIAIDDDTLLVGTSNTDGRSDPADSDDRILELTVR
jgi:glucose/arabinose dehydrogenase